MLELKEVKRKNKYKQATKWGTDRHEKKDRKRRRKKRGRQCNVQHLWTVIVTLFWLVVKWKFFSLFEFEGDFRIFFSCSYYEIWRKPLTEEFILGLLIIVIILIRIFFVEFGGFRGIGNIFGGGGFLFWRIGGWRESRTDIHLCVFTDCCWVDSKQSNSIEEFAGPWSCWGPMEASIFLDWSSEDGIKVKKAWPIPIFCGWCLSLSVTMVFWIRAWFGKVKRIWERWGAYILVATRVPD